nr:MFS transporter [Siphonobacter sp. SORGH_AS_0500]
MIFGLKVGLSFGGAIAAWLLSTFGYDAEAAVQTESAVQGIRLLVSLVPGLIFMGGATLLFGYRIDKKMEDKLELDLQARRSALLETHN